MLLPTMATSGKFLCDVEPLLADMLTALAYCHCGIAYLGLILRQCCLFRPPLFQTDSDNQEPSGAVVNVVAPTIVI